MVMCLLLSGVCHGGDSWFLEKASRTGKIERGKRYNTARYGTVLVFIVEG